MGGQGSVQSKVPLSLLIMDVAIIPRNYNAGILKDDLNSSKVISKQ